MSFQDTHDLLHKYPHYFDSIRYWQDSQPRPQQRTVIISQPRCGSTLLIRLLEQAGLSKCVGDKSMEFYRGCLDIYHDVQTNSGQYYESLSVPEAKGIFADEYRGYGSRERELLNTKYQMSWLLFANCFRSGWMKTTQLGFGNGMVLPFVTMLRDLYQEDLLTIVFLMRPIDEIVHSMKTHPDPIVFKPATMFEDILREKLVGQLEQFKQAWVLSDKRIHYKDLIADPAKALRACSPCYQPSEAAIAKVMAKKIRA